jgi:hypothetical protein
MREWVQVGGYADDLQAAYDYVNSRGGAAVAGRFLNRYLQCIDTLIAYPEICAIRPHGWRQKPIPNSTFSIFYGERGPYWMLVGIQSTVQDPDRIQAMLLIREVCESAE